jgi:hypothetical protein
MTVANNNIVERSTVDSLCGRRCKLTKLLKIDKRLFPNINSLVLR